LGKIRDTTGDPKEAVETIHRAQTAALKSLDAQHWIVNELNGMAHDFIKYVVQNSDLVLEISRKRQLYGEGAYPGLYFSKAVYCEKLGDAFLDLHQPEVYAEAKKYFSIAQETYLIYYGTQHQFFTKILQKQLNLENLCKQCSNPGCLKVQDKQCGKCKKVGYCSKECQISDWKARHKTLCK